MQYIIEVSAPTHHKLKAMFKFGLQTKLHADGSISGKDIFPSEEKAIAHLEEREIANCEHDGLVATIRRATLIERMQKDKLTELREMNRDWPATLESIERELSDNTSVDDLTYGTAKRICMDLHVDLRHLIFLF